MIRTALATISALLALALAQRVRDIAERVDPFTKRRLLELA